MARELTEGCFYRCLERNHKLITYGEFMRYFGRNDNDAYEFVAPNSHIVHIELDMVGEMSGHELTFARFSKANLARCEDPKGFNHPLNLWDTSDWFLAILGELGEAANVAKKLNRFRDGLQRQNVKGESEAGLRTKLRKELGDTFVYLDLVCQYHGFSVGDAAREVFNAKSDEIGCQIKID